MRSPPFTVHRALVPTNPLPGHVLDISRNTELRRVYVVVDAMYLEWPMTMPFSTILQDLTIEVVFWPGSGVDEIGHLNWSLLDAYVSQSMPSLRNINVRLHATNAHADECTNQVCTARMRSGDMSDAVQYVREHLPTLNNMGALQVEEIGGKFYPHL